MNNDRDPWGARPVQPAVPPRSPEQPQPVVTPVPQAVQVVPAPPVQQTPTPLPAQPVQQVVPEQGTRTLQPIDEGALLQELAAANPQKSQELDLASEQDEVKVESWTPSGIQNSKALSRDAQLPVTRPFAKEEPLEMKEGYAREPISWLRGIFAGVVVFVAWILASLASSQVRSNLLEAHKEEGVTLVEAARSIAGVSDVLMFAEIGVAAFAAYLVLRYSHKGYRALLAVGTAFFTVCLIEALPRLDIFSEYLVTTTVLVSYLGSFDGNTIVQGIGLDKLLCTVAACILSGVLGVTLLSMVVRFLRFRLPGFVLVILMCVIACAPLVIALPVIAEERAQQEQMLQQLEQTFMGMPL